jgi:hypothetical protein
MFASIAAATSSMSGSESESDELRARSSSKLTGSGGVIICFLGVVLIGAGHVLFLLQIISLMFVSSSESEESDSLE